MGGHFQVCPPNDQNNSRLDRVDTVDTVDTDMVYLEINNRQYSRLKNGFKNWLVARGYASSTVYNLPNAINEFLYYLEQNQIETIEKVDAPIIEAYWQYLRSRPNERRGGGLSTGYLKKHHQALTNFARYLQLHQSINIRINIHLPEMQDQVITVLTRKDIQDIYDVIDSTPIGLRDRAMMAVYYGCGLRRNEGVQLDIKDVMLDSRMIHVVHGKGYKERYVPIANQCLLDLREYITVARVKLLKKDNNEPALFINEKGYRITGQGLYRRLKQLWEQTGNVMPIGLHTLRHSIATHLLAEGMPLDRIAEFLGHSSTESTQVYTHLMDMLHG